MSAGEPVDPTTTAAWARLSGLADAFEPDLRGTLTTSWVEQHTLLAGDLHVDLSKNLVDDAVAKRRAAGKDLGGRRQTFTDSQIRNALRLIDGGEPATQVAKDLGMSRATLYRRIRGLPQLAI